MMIDRVHVRIESSAQPLGFIAFLPTCSKHAGQLRRLEMPNHAARQRATSVIVVTLSGRIRTRKGNILTVTQTRARINVQLLGQYQVHLQSKVVLQWVRLNHFVGLCIAHNLRWARP